jgi:hypothetical protein
LAALSIIFAVKYYRTVRVQDHRRRIGARFGTIKDARQYMRLE